MTRARLVEKLAEGVHDAWARQKRANGFHAPNECPYKTRHPEFEPNAKGCFCSKCHPDLIPYEDLTEEVKEYDRVTVRQVLDGLDAEGVFLWKDGDPVA